MLLLLADENESYNRIRTPTASATTVAAPDRGLPDALMASLHLHLDRLSAGTGPFPPVRVGQQICCRERRLSPSLAALPWRSSLKPAGQPAMRAFCLDFSPSLSFACFCQPALLQHTASAFFLARTHACSLSRRRGWPDASVCRFLSPSGYGGHSDRAVTMRSTGLRCRLASWPWRLPRSHLPGERLASNATDRSRRLLLASPARSPARFASLCACASLCWYCAVRRSGPAPSADPPGVRR